ncbi:MAG TPA: DUF3108 domain-containing protein [Candidatus Dormibacteraeota bacterium]|nr:DUF3108 domain-containing protein [Candidatus Dormibacteraeota bacterium]
MHRPGHDQCNHQYNDQRDIHQSFREENIVRRMRDGQRTVSGERHTNSMTYRMTIAIGTIAALAGAAGAFLWMHLRESAPLHALISAPHALGVTRAADRALPAAGQPSPSASDPGRSLPLGAAGFPLRPGETLEYTANVSKLNNVANLKLQVAEKRNFLGKSAWHLQAFAHTENPLRMVFELDDQFDSYSDAGTLASLQYEMRLNERGAKVESIQRMTVTGKEPAPADAVSTRVLSGTRDPLGMMQYVRSVDWTKTPEVHSPVYDGHKLYDVRATLIGTSEAVTVPAGNFTTSKIALRVFEDGLEMKDAHFTVYLTNNPARTPVLLEAVMPFMVARVELVKAQ